METNIGLFGWKRERNDNLINYQCALAKFIIEDKEFFEDIQDVLDVNEDFLGESTLRRIAGTAIDMRFKYGEITYESLESEISRWSDKYDLEEGRAWLEKIRTLPLTEEETTLYKEQFKCWRGFVLLARIANNTIDFIREPGAYNDKRFWKLADIVLDYSKKLEKAKRYALGEDKENNWE